ncbi:MAG: hypothetical protein R6U51_12825 [Anaerolineales bacterium]
MSQDFPRLISNPLSLAWEPDEIVDAKMRYRLLDAPLTRHLIGLGRSIAGFRNSINDWDWNRGWSENVNNGSYPPQSTLLTSRISVSMLIPISLILFYSLLLKIENKPVALMGVTILGIHPLLLLHGRRAMAESAVIFSVIFFIWTLHYRQRHAWLIGLAAALAYNAKQSTIALFPAGLIAVVWIKNPLHNLKKVIKNLALYTAAFCIVIIALNPVLWKHPLLALIQSWKNRLAFTQEQVSTLLNFADNQVLRSGPDRMTSLIYNLYLNKPHAYIIGDYLKYTGDVIDTYLQTPLTQMGRGLLGGTIFLALTVGGLIKIFFGFRKENQAQNQEIWLIFFATLFQKAALLIFVPFPWQRYAIPLLPFSVFWISLGLSPFLNYVFKKIKTIIPKEIHR